MKSGAVAIIGRPNVGKSTLLNALLKEKIAIVSDKPQTTRTRILGVVHHPEAQIILLDTPGLHKPQHRLNKRMVRTALETMREADLIYVLVEATSPPGAADCLVIEQVREAVEAGGIQAFLLINKVDLVNKARVLPLIEAYRTMLDWREVVPISAQTGLNVDRLLDLTVKVLPEGEALYGEDVVTDQTMRALAADLVREKILHHTRQEVPYSVAVEIERFVEEGKLARIAASVLVEKESQKAIVIGKHGERLKAIGTEARIEMERLFGMKVFLELWVKVREAWREDEQMLTELGY
ncbi:MAG: GTPase Era [Nitrospira sp.]|nr:GTPase Era [Nitrospira sp.]